jgi:hypothetical protein
MLIVMSHPDHHIEYANARQGGRQRADSAQRVERLLQTAGLAEESIKPEPRVMGSTERAPDYVIPHRDQVGALPRHQLPGNHPSDAILRLEKPPRLIGGRSISHMRVGIRLPERDASGDFALRPFGFR